ncbi:hypothetical protein [Microcystis aeruginosa]|uniref:hypothetical protein n=1 Tax=Microcystis aeruginosa TaxID=1126 RepID=UPI001330B625|nr:hypothetical protein [Microcystis aeruginosa]
MRSQESGVSPDEKIFTTRDERGFFPHTPHPTPHTLHPLSSQETGENFPGKSKKKDSKVKICLFPIPRSLFPVPFSN